ncbi:MAG: glycosyltransferase family 2 protein [Terriglobales bacterium]
MGQELVSVVIPAYKAASRIRKTLDSVYAQTYTNFEIVLVNDGSPDSKQLEDEIRGYDQRLIYIKQENQGPSSARNTAIRAAHGKYIACLDSDDVYLPEHLARLVSHLESNNLQLVYSDCYFIKGGKHVGRSFEREPQSPPVTFEKLLTEDCCVGTSAMMATRQAMIDAGLFDEHYWRCEDFDLWLRMSFRGAKMDLVPEVGMEHHVQSDGLAADPYLLNIARAEVYRKTLATLPLGPEQRTLVEKLIALTDGRSQMDLVRSGLREHNYSQARSAASKAASLLGGGKTRTLAVALQFAPWAVRWYMNRRDVRQQNRKRDSRCVTKDQSGNGSTEKPSDVQLQSKVSVKQ